MLLLGETQLVERQKYFRSMELALKREKIYVPNNIFVLTTNKNRFEIQRSWFGPLKSFRGSLLFELCGLFALE